VPLTGDAYRAEGAGGELPSSLDRALDALDADEELCAAMGTELVEAFAAMKRFEVERFNAWTTDWEIDEYQHHL
jgi:glutamine synthetase